jgi:hypothetical protein
MTQEPILTKEEAADRVIRAAREAVRLPGNKAALAMLKIALDTYDATVIAAQDVDRE